jgi:Cu2+-exporting ATPase
MSTCTLCDLPTPDPPVTDSEVDGSFCCRGCLEVARTLDEPASADAEAAREALDTGDAADPAEVDGEAAFFDVEGMHCATCEVFIEDRATSHEGVHAAEASYASDMVKLVYDPETVARDSLPALLTGLGYSARDLDSEADHDDQELTGRLLVGGFFGMMVMLWYVLFLYPTYFGVDPDALFLDVTGVAGTYLLGNIWIMSSVVLFFTGYPILRGAYVSLRSGHPNMDLLVALAATTAYVYSTVTLALGGTEVYFDISVVVVLVVSIGTYYETTIKERAASALTELTEERVDRARRRIAASDAASDEATTTEEVAIDDLGPGDEVVVRPGERVPVDGTVVEGTAAVDESLVTGESVPERKTSGESVIGGALVTDGALVVTVDDAEESTLDRLVTRLWDIQSARPGAQRLADRLAAVFVPLVIVLAVIAVGVHGLALGAMPTAALLTGLAVLVVSCPCALGLATPLAVASAIREALDRGIVVTDESVFEAATETDVVAFDKTGTLTTGRMQVVETAVGDGDGTTSAPGTVPDGGTTTTDTDGSAAATDRTILGRASAVEQFSDHPLAAAITDHTAPPDVPVDDFERHPGQGVSATVDGQRVVVGRAALFETRDWAIPAALRDRYEAARDAGQVPALVGWDGRARGLVVGGDTPRPEWESVVTDLGRDHGVVVITGDDERAADRFRDHDAVDQVFAGVPPEAKAEVVERLRSEGVVAMVGDGSNDAPALAAADLGIALESGTRLAADAADAVITTDDLTAVPRVFALTRAARRRIRQNLGWAFLYNAIAVPLTMAGLINPLFAAVAMATSSLLVVGNSSRSLLADK